MNKQHSAQKACDFGHGLDTEWTKYKIWGAHENARATEGQDNLSSCSWKTVYICRET